jgi:uncharacterized protein YigE (DUF2233 family)
MNRFRFARGAALLALACVGASSGALAACRSEAFEGVGLTVCTIDLTADRLAMFWRSDDGQPYATFDALAAGLENEGRRLTFAMNAGMYDDDLSPIGLYVEEGRELVAANTTSVAGEGAAVPNFYKKPNGIFYVGDGTAGVMETGAFLEQRPAVRFATQSGPMLLVGGEIHPAFIEGSTDRKRRDGVCASTPTKVQLAISEDGVNFHDFARFFRDVLGCKDALFLDGGSAPGLYAPELGRDDAPGHGGYGPIIAVTADIP